MQIKPGNFCPLIQKDCIGLECSWFTQVRGTNVNTGEEVDDWNCAITWLPLMLIENANQSRRSTEAVENFRTEMYHSNQSNQAMLVASAQILQQSLPPQNQ